MGDENRKRLPALFWGRRRPLLIRLFCLGFAQAFLAIVVAYLTRDIVRSIGQPGADVGQSEFFLGMLAGLGVAAVVGFALRVLAHREAERLAENYVTRIRLRLFDALTSAPVLTTRQSSLGPTLLRFVTDLSAVRQWISLGLSRLIISALAMLGGAVAFFIIDPLIGFCFVAIFVSACGLTIALGAELRRRVSHARKQRSRLASKVADRLRALCAVQTSGRVSEERSEIRRRSRNLADAAVARAAYSGIMRALPDAGLGVLTILILWIGGEQIAQGDQAFSSIIAAITVLGVLSPNVRNLGRVYEYWVNYQVAAAKLDEILARRKTSHRRRKVDDGVPQQGALSFDGATVKGAFSGISAQIPAGQVVAIIGPSGCGKSALLGAVARLLKLNAGRIDMDEQDISRLTDKAFAAGVGVLSSDLPLVRGTLRHNLTYRFKQASQQDIERVLDLCDLEDEITRLPGGLQTRVSEDDVRFSGGFRQRILLARAVIGATKVLLLDEPDSGLDPSGRRIVDRILDEGSATVLMATNDRARIARADLIWRMKGGRLVETVSVLDGLTGDGETAQFLGNGFDENTPQNVVRADFAKNERLR